MTNRIIFMFFCLEVPKPKLRKVERRFVPVLEKLSVEELMETNTYVRFNRSIEQILENFDDSAVMGKFMIFI